MPLTLAVRIAVLALGHDVPVAQDDGDPIAAVRAGLVPVRLAVLGVLDLEPVAAVRLVVATALVVHLAGLDHREVETDGQAGLPADLGRVLLSDGQALAVRVPGQQGGQRQVALFGQALREPGPGVEVVRIDGLKTLVAQASIQPYSIFAIAARLALVEVSRMYSPGQFGSS